MRARHGADNKKAAGSSRWGWPAKPRSLCLYGVSRVRHGDPSGECPAERGRSEADASGGSTSLVTWLATKTEVSACVAKPARDGNEGVDSAGRKEAIAAPSEARSEPPFPMKSGCGERPRSLSGLPAHEARPDRQQGSSSLIPAWLSAETSCSPFLGTRTGQVGWLIQVVIGKWNRRQ